MGSNRQLYAILSPRWGFRKKLYYSRFEILGLTPQAIDFRHFVADESRSTVIGSGKPYRVGDGVAPVALPQHRTYGSVYGASS